MEYLKIINGHNMSLFSDSKKATLFLDRDGVINRRVVDGYVTHPDELVILRGVTEAMAVFTSFFQRIIVVSNQQGVGKGIMTSGAVHRVHAYLKERIARAGGRIDGIYFCPALESENHPWRKPSTGMALAAQNDFPEIEFSHAWMAGDSRSDMLFARRLNMRAVFIETEPTRETLSPDLFDLRFPSLLAFAHFLQNEQNSTSRL